jgi:mannitol-1-phosphate 5-dehydrogenase
MVREALEMSTFVGFGFGPIQTGLMLFEAAESGRFDRFVVSEVDQALVDAVRGAGNSISINIAGRSGIRTRKLSGIELYNPKVLADREKIVPAITDATEMATAVPNVKIYAAGGEASIAALIAAGARPGRHRIIYTAENNNYAAEALQEEVGKLAGAAQLADLQILNTVIGKMSGVISSAEEMRRLGLAPLVPGFERCVLVEEFNRILITRITLPGFRRGIGVFEEKDDLLPFEEAKLFGHNAIHALLGYLALLRGYDTMSRIGSDKALLALGRDAFMNESGAGLMHKHSGTGDPLFSYPGFTAYAEDLLERMVNPYLFDRVDRIIRDPRRKLGWNDRLFGTMRLAMRNGVEPRCMALGAAAAAEHAITEEKLSCTPRRFLTELWGAEAGDPEREACLSLVEKAIPRLEDWSSRA